MSPPLSRIAAPAGRIAEPLRWTGLALTLLAATARGLTPVSLIPHWDLDPLVFSAPIVGVGPAGSLAFDGAMLLGAGLALLGEALSGRRILLVPCLLAAIGSLAILWHGWLSPDRTLGHQRVGAAWASAIAAGLAATHLCRDAALRRILAATFVGFVGVLALKGAQQLLIEHPQTIEDFRRNRAAFLAAQGWEPGSSQALSYERRMNQPEATGWYGLANVYSSIAAASVAIGIVLVCGWLRDRVRKGTGAAPGSAGFLLLAALGAGVVGLAMGGAKGGYLAMMLALAAGASVAMLASWSARSAGSRGPTARSVAGLIGLGAIILPFALIILRGQIGERLHELSLFFRWFYMQAALRIGFQHWLTGVGPDGFQQAYLLAKNPLSPEDVKSPHIIVLDWWATMGVLGLAWVGLLGWWMWHGARAAFTPPHSSAAPPAPDHERTAIRTLGLIAAGATIVGALLDHGFMTPDSAAVRVLGLVLWFAVGWGVLAATRHGLEDRSLRIAMFAGAAAIAAHSQIDVVASWPASAGLFALMIGAAAAGTDVGAVARRTWRAASLLPGVAVVALAVLVAADGAAPAARWESHLAAAAAPVAGLGGLSQRIVAAGSINDPDARAAELSDIAHEFYRLSGQRVEPSQTSLGRAISQALASGIPGAVEGLLRADELKPDEWRVHREASRLCLVLASMLRSGGRSGDAEAARWEDRAVEIARGLGRDRRPRAEELTWRGLVYRARAEARSSRDDLRQAADALERAMALDPYSLDSAMRLFRVHRELGERDKAAAVARRALELDELARLDRDVRGLREADRAEVRAAASGS